MSNPDRIYLDNAATSFPKPESVYDAVDTYNRSIGAAVGRSAYRESIEVQRVVNRCRSRAAEVLGAGSPDRIAFTFNATDSLNLALHGLLNAGDHVVTSTVEHNSVLRPLRELQRRRQVEVTYIEPDEVGRVDPAHVQDALQPNTRLVALIHASNVTGTIQPIEAVGELARNAGALFLVDAAQTTGHVPIDLQQLPVDVLACPGHKGLLGPLGTGLLYVRPGVEDRLPSLKQGGTGSNSEDDHQPNSLPDKYETGNHNAPGLFGLHAALEFIQQRGIESLQTHEHELTGQLLEGFAGIAGVRSFGTSAAEGRVGVASIAVEGFEPQILATILDENFGIQTRAGLHCAPRMHQSLGTLDSGGTVRFSVGPFNTPEDVDAAVRAIKEVAGAV